MCLWFNTQIFESHPQTDKKQRWTNIQVAYLTPQAQNKILFPLKYEDCDGKVDLWNDVILFLSIVNEKNDEK